MIHEIGPEELSLYAQIPIAFEVRTVFHIELLESGLGGMRLLEEPVQPAYLKDYDDSAEGGPRDWPRHFDVRNWGFLLAGEKDAPSGAAAVAFNTGGIFILEGRRDLAVLWDIRVQPTLRGTGIGTQLFQHSIEWARGRGCGQMKVETQNVNVPACQFYARQGCTLGAIHRFGYAGIPRVAHEAMLLWYLDL